MVSSLTKGGSGYVLSKLAHSLMHRRSEHETLERKCTLGCQEPTRNYPTSLYTVLTCGHGFVILWCYSDLKTVFTNLACNYSLFVYLWITKQSQFCRTLTSLSPGSKSRTKPVSKPNSCKLHYLHYHPKYSLKLYRNKINTERKWPLLKFALSGYRVQKVHFIVYALSLLKF